MATRIPASFCCANTGDDWVAVVGADVFGQACKEKATNICTQCFLVQYCSRECQKAHWITHKSDCKSALMKPTWLPDWDLEGREPSFLSVGTLESMGWPTVERYETGDRARKLLWGNVPAIDVLNLKDNEGIDVVRDLRVVFAASGDIRNAVKTVVELPDSYPGTCDLVLNDIDPSIVIRNAILLLTALTSPPEEAAPMMLHVWYSAFLPTSTFLALQENILPLVQAVCSEIQGHEPDVLMAKLWNFGGRKATLTIVLKKSQWVAMLSFFCVPEGLSKMDAQRVGKETTLKPERVDYLHRELHTQKPATRVGMMRFREDGILLPFGASRQGFDVPNPTLFQSADFWPMMDTADPLHSWSTGDVRAHVPLASNDSYAGLYFYVYDLLLKFCTKVNDLNLSFSLLQVHALQLYESLENAELLKQGFDRVDASNLADTTHLSPHPTLTHLSKLLSPSPNSTLLLLFLHSIYTTAIHTSVLSASSSATQLQNVLQYLPLPAIRPLDTSAYMLSAVSARVHFWGLEWIFERFVEKNGFEAAEREAGVRRKEGNGNTITKRWPYRLIRGASQGEFEELRASGCMGTERYVELKRV